MIDWKRVSSLRQEIGAEDFEEISVLFIEEVEDVITRLRCHTDDKSLEEDFHFLKGSALNLGFNTLAKICQGGENRAREGTLDRDYVDRTITTYESSREEFMIGPREPDRITG